jgi:predicted RNase H-like nuclease (RuvC/YqgF family)
MKQAHEDPNIGAEHRTESEHPPMLMGSGIPVRVMDANERACMATDMVYALTMENSHLEAYVMLKNAADVLDQACEIAKDKATMEATKDAKVLNAEVTTRRSVAYEYEDGTLEELETKIEDLKKQADERRKLLRTLKTPMADSQTGELIMPAKLVKDGISLVVKLPK